MEFLGQLLILILLFITNFRVFFIKNVQKDSLVILPFVSLFLSILQIIAWNLNFFNFICFFLAFCVLLTNFHPIFRFFQNLYIDHYSSLMTFWAVLTSLICGFFIVLLVYFVPFNFQSKKNGITTIQTRFFGNFRDGFEESSPFHFANTFVTEFHNENLTENSPIILFIPDKCGDTQNYKPYLELLAKQNFRIFSGDFYSKDSKWFYSLLDSKFFRREFFILQNLFNNHEFTLKRELYTYNIQNEISAMIKILDKKFGENQKYYLISDSMGKTAINDFYIKNKEKVNKIFCLSDISEYSTKGFGCVKQTNPLLAKILNQSRDYKSETADLLIKKTIEFIK